ncbi:hypothetical protein G7Y79_00008g023660 [Physcia stellaris]|nr:hypothetical protein G7Y79_00008g023660 [Physcia stellaris]
MESPLETEAAGNAWNSAFEQRLPKRMPDLPRRIHILGVGNVGLLIAHSLAGIPNRPPITLLTRTRASMRVFKDAGQCVELVTDGISDIRGGFDVEFTFENAEDPYPSLVASEPRTYKRSYTSENSRYFDTSNAAEATSASEAVSPLEANYRSEQRAADDTTSQSSEDLPSAAEQDLNYISPTSHDQGVITNLIVTLKSKDIIAISRVAHRLTKDSAILFLQNGMGYIEEINKKIFSDPKTRPTYIIGVVTHGAKRSKAFSVVHAGHGTISLSIMPRASTEVTDSTSPSARYLLRTITRTPVLAAVAYGPTDILQQQLEKLAVNCVINPLTAVMDCTNGDLMGNFHVSKIMRLVLAEVSLVIRSLPELQNVPNVQSRFDPGRLELYTIQVVGMTSQNLSSMLQDVRAGRETEIDYLNGYIIRRGEELGIRCIVNYMLVQMLEAKQKIVLKNDLERLPLGSEDSLKVIQR